MKRYRTSQDELRRSGITIPVCVSHLAAATEAGLPPKLQSLDLLGTVDTGAWMSMIRLDCARQLGLVSRGTTPLITFHGNSSAPTYPVHLRVQDEWEDEMVIAGGEFKGQDGLDFLIGRDVLQHAEVSWHGPNGSLEIHFC